MPSSPIFPCMRLLDLSFCNLVEIPDAIGIMSCLQWLDLSVNNFATLPNLKKLSKLLCLKLQHCKQLKSLPELPSRIDLQTGAVGAGLYIFNCPELVDRERCTDMGFSWMMQLCQVLYSHPLYVVRSVTPGSEIRRWFNNEHDGNCVSLDASPVMHDDNWIGVAFCAIFVVPQETISAMGFSSQHWSHFGYIRWKESYAEEKKYGYGWVYKGDIEQRKRKFGEIEENEGKRKKGIMSAEGRKDDATSSQEKTIKLLQNEFENLRL
uniref:Uncharacterized protein n=1 Tax=Glycine max TaxID=3847 RepID=A0A0R0JTI7_SOYBN